MSPSRWLCCLETQMHNDIMLNGVIGICLWIVDRQLPIPNQKKERFMAKVKLHSACDCHVTERAGAHVFHQNSLQRTVYNVHDQHSAD